MHRKRVMPADSTTRAGAKDNQTFLHARFGLGEDILKPYKETLDRWLWPDVLRKQDTSVVKAKQTISSYRKAVGGTGRHCGADGVLLRTRCRIRNDIGSNGL
jgi:hypothetical protein